jgi:hypothetical protein
MTGRRPSGHFGDAGPISHQHQAPGAKGIKRAGNRRTCALRRRPFSRREKAPGATVAVALEWVGALLYRIITFKIVVTIAWITVHYLHRRSSRFAPATAKSPAPRCIAFKILHVFNRTPMDALAGWPQKA